MAIDLNNETVIIYNNVYLGRLVRVDTYEVHPVLDEQDNIIHYKTKIRVESVITGEHGVAEHIWDGGGAIVPVTPQYAASGTYRTDGIVHMMRDRISKPRKNLYILNSG